MAHWLATLRGRGVGTRTVVLVAVVLVVWGIVAVVAGALAGAMALAAASVAAALCLAGAVAALLSGHWLRDPKLMLHALLAGMATRMGIPLAAGLVIHLRGGLLSDAGVLYYLLLFYPVTLGVETFLSLPSAGVQSRTDAAPPEKPLP